MESMTDPTQLPALPEKHQEKEGNGLFGGMSFRLAETIGVGATLASGWVAAWNGIRDNFYRNISRYKVFKDVHEVREREYTELYQRFADKHQKEELIAGIQAIEKKYTTEVAKRMEGLGIINTFDRWRTLKTHQKAEIAVTVAGVSAILLGAVVNLSASRRIREEQAQLTEQITQNEHMQR